jgi:ABC-type antimicrobial peptide transport system permease subunit
LFNVVARTAGEPEAAAGALRQRLKAHDPNLAAYEIRSMEHWMRQSSSLMRIRTLLIIALGGFALVLGVVGIYGVISYLVALRAREFGIRLALGARPGTLPLAVVAQQLRLTVVGIALGLGAALLVVERMQSLLFEVDARDPASFGAVALLVAVTGLLASYLPARRAARADPLVVMRAE